MNVTLSVTEVRILGCLIEKQATTPDGYPLTLNSLVSACNQKSNREPVTNLDESELLSALDTLIEKNLASIYKSERNRMAKYQHKLHNRLFDEFNFSLAELAVLCVLFLRGPQTPGEIRTRSARIHEFPDMASVNGVLTGLEENSHGPYVVMLPRRAGHKESRYGHLFCGEIAEATTPYSAATPGSSTSGTEVEGLELEVQELREKLQELESRFDKFVEQFE